MNEDKVDLSPLDPARDAERWEGLIRSVVARAVAQRRVSVPDQLRAWTWPALAVAAAIPLVVWLGSLAYPRSSSSVAASSDPSALIASWAAAGELPSTSEMFQALGGNDVQH